MKKYDPSSGRVPHYQNTINPGDPIKCGYCGITIKDKLYNAKFAICSQCSISGQQESWHWRDESGAPRIKAIMVYMKEEIRKDVDKKGFKIWFEYGYENFTDIRSPNAKVKQPIDENKCDCGAPLKNHVPNGFYCYYGWR